MKILDKPYTAAEKDNAIRMLEGCKNRICVSDDVDEIILLLGSATNHLSMLAYSRIKQLQENGLINSNTKEG